MKEYTKTYVIFFKERREAEGFVEMIGGFISDSYREFLRKYCGEYVDDRTIVLIHTSKYFMKSLSDIGIKRRRVNNKTVYEKT